MNTLLLFFLARLSTFYDVGIDEAIDIVYKRNKTSQHFILPESHRSKVNCDWLTWFYLKSIERSIMLKSSMTVEIANKLNRVCTHT
jgi:hypothetical protein